MKKNSKVPPKAKPLIPPKTSNKNISTIKQSKLHSKASTQRSLSNRQPSLASNQSVNSSSIITTISNQKKQSSPLSLKEQIDNLTSIYNALLYIDYNLDKTFRTQRNSAEVSLNEKTISNLKLKEENFKLFSKLNNMNDISNIDEYFLNSYEKMMSNAPKVNNIIENMNDFISNINYGLDRLYLNGNIACDESLLRKSITTTINDIDLMHSSLIVKKEELNTMKDNYSSLLGMISKHKEQYDTVERMISAYKTNFLCDNIDKINKSLQEENKILLNNIIE